ncbi:uncharacterized protein [Elaeis guineensis]|uniref:uncharacterized protein isoform X2 n=1 Tax=Elaeis guineensis var. tenera TaxID=51953 RepID=UPI003C6D6809
MSESSPIPSSRSITSPGITPTIPEPRLSNICTSVTRGSAGCREHVIVFLCSRACPIHLVLMVSLRRSMLNIRAPIRWFSEFHLEYFQVDSENLDRLLKATMPFDLKKKSSNLVEPSFL